MSFLDGIDISASGLTAQRLRLDTIANNMANVESTRVKGGNGPYRRQVVIFESRPRNPVKGNFATLLRNRMTSPGGGVRVSEIRSLNDDQAPFKRVYEPGHPDADELGYVTYPNVNVVEEMVNMISATRAYEANAKVIEATRAMANRALSIGR